MFGRNEHGLKYSFMQHIPCTPFSFAILEMNNTVQASLLSEKHESRGIFNTSLLSVTFDKKMNLILYQSGGVGGADRDGALPNA
jgi:hypothetical protein